ncbi:YcaO-like family protein [Streptomyces sp. NPDC087850]|uniref:YcaO-like family protein n=1 Tax=Streptomyces sp. NPDC087850 TaxID=3365809 RepID=UPI00382CE1BD
MSRIVLDGTVRSRTPEETWQALEGITERVGITRVARITDLDYLGIPVWTAIRPHAHTLVTSQGKGATDLLAKVSAVLESVELWHVEQPLAVATRGTYRSLDVAYPMSALPVKLYHDRLESIPLDWAIGTGLASGRDLLVPADLARRHIRRNGVVPNLFHVTSNGLACGNTADEATLHALFEVIERDVLHRDYSSGGQHRVLIAPDSVEDSYCRDLVNRFLNANMFLEIALVSSAYEIPVCAVYIWSEDYPIMFAGSGCHRDPHIALSRALTEAAQSRLTCIAGTRDDLESHESAFVARPSRPKAAWPHTASWPSMTARYASEDVDFASEGIAVAKQVTLVTGYEPILLNLAQSDAYTAVKVVSPGLAMRVTRSIPRPGGCRG